MENLDKEIKEKIDGMEDAVEKAVKNPFFKKPIVIALAGAGALFMVVLIVSSMF